MTGSSMQKVRKRKRQKNETSVVAAVEEPLAAVDEESPINTILDHQVVQMLFFVMNSVRHSQLPSQKFVPALTQYFRIYIACSIFLNFNLDTSQCVPSQRTSIFSQINTGNKFLI